jgi:hypothetical protein
MDETKKMNLHVVSLHQMMTRALLAAMTIQMQSQIAWAQMVRMMGQIKLKRVGLQVDVSSES